MTCPYCGSGKTELRSELGSTACKAIHFCNACQQPFDEFKAFWASHLQGHPRLEGHPDDGC